MRFMPHSLQHRFLLGLVLILLLMGGLFTLGLQIHTRDLLLSEGRQKARIMMAYTEATQDYVRNILRPTVSRLISEDDFVLEAMSTSFVTRNILASLDLDPASFAFRRVSKNARNPDYEVTADEEQFMQAFMANDKLTQTERLVSSGKDKLLMVARPIYFQQSCLKCHGDPADAPAVLIHKYGDQRGFFRKAGELAGLEVLSIPLLYASDSVARTASDFAIWFGLGMLVLLLVIQLFFSRLVVHNLRRVGEILQRAFFQGGHEELLAPLQQEEEIEGMIRSIEAIATHLSEAREQLNDYARNLENKVRDRTREMEGLVAARSADVDLFVRLLRRLNQSEGKQQLLLISLELLGKHFRATGALYACSMGAADFTLWLDQSNAANPQIPPHVASLAKSAPETPMLQERFWLFPVQTSGQIRGALGLFWDEQPPVLADSSLAFAFATQLGIALDNFDAIDALLQQNTLLDSLVEGVPDPLLLLDCSGAPLLANSSARILADRLWSLSDHADSTGDVDQGLRLCALIQDMGITPTDLRGAENTALREVTSGSASFTLGIYPFVGAERQVQRSVVHIHETTEEKALLGHLRHSEKLAAVGQLAASIAHEVNNPLGVIRCYAELLEKSAQGQQKTDAQVIVKHVDSAQGVLSDLLRFARPKAEITSFCRIDEMLASLLKLFKPKACKSRVDISLDLDSDLPCVRTDTGMLEQVVLNLLLNALDAVSPGQGKIQVHAGHDAPKKQVFIRIADNGPGIEDAVLSKLFDPFFTTKKRDGTGLGLTIAFGLMRELGGSLEVRNLYIRKEKSGAEFILTLPEELVHA